MNDLHVFALGGQRISWLTARSVAVASNIANADVPNYQAKDVVSFEQTLSNVAPSISTTHRLHFQPPASTPGGIELRNAAGPEFKHSGNTVSMETELSKVGDIKSANAITTGVLSAFHRMLLASTKG